MFGISLSEAILIFLVLLICVGPQQIPVVLSKLAFVYKKANVFTRQIRQSIDDSLYDISMKEQNISNQEIKNNTEKGEK